MEKLRIGAAGMGIGSVAVLEAARRIVAGKLDVELALCDLKPAAVTTVQKQVHEKTGLFIGKTYPTLAEMLPNVDGVYIATPNFDHLPSVKLACAAGKHVWCEKPPALSLDEMGQIAAAVDEAEVAYMLQLNNNRTPWFRKIMRWLGQGKIGRLFHIKLRWKRRKGVPFRGMWFTSKEKAGGGVLIDLSPHLLGLLYEMLGRGAELVLMNVVMNESLAAGQRPNGPYGGGATGDGEDDVEVDARLHMVFMQSNGNRVTVDLDVAWAAHDVECEEFEVTATGDAGAITQLRRWPKNNGSDLEAVDSLVLRTQEDGVPVDVYWNPLQDSASVDPLMGRGMTIDDYLRSMRMTPTERAAYYDSPEGILMGLAPAWWLMRVINLAYRSAVKGPLFDDGHDLLAAA